MTDRTKKVFKEVFDEIDNMSQEDINRINNNIREDRKKKQIEEFGVEYEKLNSSAYSYACYNELEVLFNALNDLLKLQENIQCGHYIIKKVKYKDDDLFGEDKRLKILFSHEKDIENYKVITIYRNEYFNISNHYEMLHKFLNNAYKAKSYKKAAYDSIINSFKK